MDYTPYQQPNGDLASIKNANGENVAYSDPAFQAWLAQQTMQVKALFQLSQAQQIIQTLKGTSYQNWQNVAQAQKDRILYEIVQRALKQEIV